MTDIKRYEQFGWDYDRYNPREERAEAWYLDHLASAGGPVLEIACGGGKLLPPIAEAGYEVTGLDLSEAMLGRARERVASLPPEVASRITLERADMSDFDLGRTFATVILADNSFRELETRDELTACLGAIRRHLPPGGRFLLTEARFDPGLYPDGRRSGPWTAGDEHPVTGEIIRRRVISHFRTDPPRIEGVMYYETTAADGTVTVTECPYVGAVLAPEEYLAMLAETGFEAVLRMDYGGVPDEGTRPMLCFVATAV